MSEQFVRPSNPDLERRIAAAQSVEEIRRIASEGVIDRNRVYELQGQLIGHPEQSNGEVPSSASGYKYEKEIRWHERLNKRPVIIRANTPEQLAELERILTQ